MSDLQQKAAVQQTNNQDVKSNDSLKSNDSSLKSNDSLDKLNELTYNERDEEDTLQDCIDGLNGNHCVVERPKRGVGTSFGRRPESKRRGRSRISSNRQAEEEKEKIKPEQYPIPKTELDHWLWTLVESLNIYQKGSLGSYIGPSYIGHKVGQLSHAEGKGLCCSSEIYDHYIERVMLAESKILFTTSQIEWMNQHIVQPLTEVKTIAELKLTDEAERIKYAKQHRYWRNRLADNVRQRLIKNNSKPGIFNKNDIQKIDLNSWSDFSIILPTNAN
jgi:hypothetical protein